MSLGSRIRLLGNVDTAKLGLANNQCVNARSTSLLEDFELLPSKWMERMTHLCPSQMRTAVECSSH